MPMPRLPATHQNKTASANPFHVKKNSAAMAPRWNAIMKREVTQMIGWVNVLSRLKMLITLAVPRSGILNSDFKISMRGGMPL